MCLDLSVGLLEFSIIIAAVFSQNKSLGLCLDNIISSSMQYIYFTALAP